MNSNLRSTLSVVAVFFAFTLLAAPTAEALQVLSESGKVVVFQRDIVPVFVSRCLECHQGDKAKADFRIDDRESVLAYVTPEDAEGSTLYYDYVLADDPDMMMPPASHGGPLSAAEVSLLRVWIEEGADWPEDATVSLGDSATEEAEPNIAPVSNSLAARAWSFQGYFHPATVHFPIALLSIGGLFVILGLKWPKVGTQIPLACLLIGSVSAVVASAMGWSFAWEKGFGNYQMSMAREIDAHRWSGTIVAGASLVLAVVALASVRSGSKKMNAIWKTGLLGLAITVGLVGHQGGELTYPKLYERAFERLLGTPPPTEQSSDVATISVPEAP